MITLAWLYVLAGATFAAFAVLSLSDRTNSKRFGNAAFWGLIAISFFFGEDIFVAFGAIVLMQTILQAEGIAVDPLHMALWGIPTAISAFIIHAWNLRRLDAHILREVAKA